MRDGCNISEVFAVTRGSVHIPPFNTQILEIYLFDYQIASLFMNPFYTLSQRLSKQTASKMTKDGKSD